MGLDVKIKPPFAERAKAVTARSISPTSRKLIALTSTPTDGATDWMTANCPTPEVTAGSRSTAARVTPGAICLSSSSHFPLRLNSKVRKPVALPPGRARLSTKPEPTGSGTSANTIGTLRVACNNGATPEEPAVKMTSGASATNSAAYLRIVSGLPAPYAMQLQDQYRVQLQPPPVTDHAAADKPPF
jgi:hypothetical protein